MQPFQPLRQGLYARGAHLNRRPLQKVRRLLHYRRGIRAHRLRAPRARLYGHAARHVRSNHRCSSLSKTYSITGWRLGYTIAPAQITERIKKVHDFLTVGAAAPLQEAVVTALKFDDSYYQEVLDLYTAKRDLFCQGLDSIGLEHNVPQGAYYVMMDISEFGYDSDLDFCEDLASKVGVGAVPGSSFFREPVNHLIRFHFAKRDETLNAALENLKSLRDKINPRG